MNVRDLLRLIKKNRILKLISKKLMKVVPIIQRAYIFRTYFRQPYSDSLLERNVIFVHVPKTAGNGIVKSLFGGYDELNHFTIHDFKKINKNYFAEAYKIGFVRNPWDRLVSAFFYLKQGGSSPLDQEFRKKYLKDITFEEFVYKLKENSYRNKIFKWVHFTPQHKFLCNDQGEIQVDYLGRYETLTNDFENLKMVFQIPNIRLDKHNTSKHKDYWDYYNYEMMKIVEEVYKDDVEIFKYRFPSQNINC
ncbi:sulfotransferase family 2 domain-containing protein [Virgibacillus siamensis]|uniref:sulfotransferase family 2 domain-containing protein n=1 Tax=Virgibacillus siamensis TaxID=480071 RepID=UPI00158E7C94|nr:sulfotransferase family 2 domain-containing protein [Virgibacillus siamensis]